MRPVIGICCDTRLSSPADKSLVPMEQDFQNRDYVRSVVEAGGAPVLLPCRGEDDLIAVYLESVDGLIVSGGDDMDPRHYRQEPSTALGRIDPLRDGLDLAIIPAALKRQVPMLCVCRGLQSLNVVLGGTLYQDIPAEVPNAVRHRQRAPWGYPTHVVELACDSRAAQLMGAGTVDTNTFHHQGIRDLGEGLSATGHTFDGLIEAAELPSHPFCIGVQWHPEHMTAGHEHARALFTALVDACRG